MNVGYEIFLSCGNSDKADYDWTEAEGTLMIEVKRPGAKHSCAHIALRAHMAGRELSSEGGRGRGERPGSEVRMLGSKSQHSSYHLSTSPLTSLSFM